jgi:heparan-alpha-glucosaminide N-acetyltransferase
MFTMVFVNDVAGVETAPWWMKHYEESGRGKNGMTFVDVVFPAFLFIVGMSIPLAVESRRNRGDSWLQIWFHILLRTAALLFLGVLMVNNPSAKAMGWPGGLWQTLMYSAAIVTFISLPVTSRGAKVGVAIARLAGLATLIWLAWVFKDRHGHHVRHSWWGILGLIGWAYLVVCVIAIPLRFNRSFMLMGMALLMCLFFADRTGLFDGTWLADQLSIGETLGSQAAIAMAGAILGTLLMRDSTVSSPSQRIGWATGFAIAMALAGVLLYRTYWINKNSATPTWCLYCAAITGALWVMLYLIIDVAGLRAWSMPLAWAGASALMIYLLHPLFDSVLSVTGMHWYGNLGDTAGVGIIRSLCLAAALCLFAGLIGRKGVRLRL